MIEIYHHGILGQRWGIRRFQNKDGSLTSEGKKRYASKELEKDISEKLKNNADIVNSIVNDGREIEDFANSLGKQYTDAFKKVSSSTISTNERNRIWNNLHDDFGDSCDDEKDFNMMVKEYVEPFVWKPVSSNIYDQYQAFEEMQKTYWNKVETFTKDIRDKYDDSKIVDLKTNTVRDGKNEVSKLLYHEGLKTSFISYLGRHFSDYWINDTEEYYDAVDRLSSLFTMDEYNKRYKNS